MAVDDHAINSLRTWFDIEYEELKKEWKSGQYETLSDCPSFKVTYTYREALNVLIKGSRYIDETQLKKMIDEELEVENFWKEKS
jgi:hypothetical protein